MNDCFIHKFDFRFIAINYFDSIALFSEQKISKLKQGHPVTVQVAQNVPTIIFRKLG